MAKPGIIVLSKDGDDCFNWMSDGWNEAARAGTPKAVGLMSKARECIAKGDSVLEVIALLEKAGFEVVRSDPS